MKGRVCWGRMKEDCKKGRRLQKRKKINVVPLGYNDFLPFKHNHV
jgi:hypothetical protein